MPSLCWTQEIQQETRDGVLALMESDLGDLTLQSEP